MLTITYIHNRVREATFPAEELTKLGVTVTKTKGPTIFADTYTLSVDMSGETDSAENVAFSLGMLVHSYLNKAK